MPRDWRSSWWAAGRDRVAAAWGQDRIGKGPPPAPARRGRAERRSKRQARTRFSRALSSCQRPRAGAALLIAVAAIASTATNPDRIKASGMLAQASLA